MLDSVCAAREPEPSSPFPSPQVIIRPSEGEPVLWDPKELRTRCTCAKCQSCAPGTDTKRPPPPPPAECWPTVRPCPSSASPSFLSPPPAFLTSRLSSLQTCLSFPSCAHFLTALAPPSEEEWCVATTTRGQSTRRGATRSRSRGTTSTSPSSRTSCSRTCSRQYWPCRRYPPGCRSIFFMDVWDHLAFVLALYKLGGLGALHSRRAALSVLELHRVDQHAVVLLEGQ
eukprot:3312645-Rhodomonas_salina.2